MRYYELLGLSAACTEAEVRAAYRRLVKQLHPDSGAGDVERFREIQEAYETLSHPERRRAYDSAHRFPVSWMGGFQEPLASWRDEFRRRPAGSSLACPPLEIVLTEEEASRGGDAVIETACDLPCDRCGGGGFDFFGPCTGCRGEGARRCYERILFAIPRGAEAGDVVTGRREGGEKVEARIRLASRGTGRAPRAG